MNRVVVLKSDRLYGDLISRHLREFARHTEILVYQRGFDALDSIQAQTPDLLITGVRLPDMDGLEHLEPFVDRPLPVLIVTSRTDVRTFAMMREIRYDGVYDAMTEGLQNLRSAVARVLQHELYISPSFSPLLAKQRRITLDALTPKEELVLSIIGDGSDDHAAAERLRLSSHTVNTHRKAIMAKLKLHHKGQLVCYAVRMGYVDISSAGITYPGFRRRLVQAGDASNGSEASVA